MIKLIGVIGGIKCVSTAYNVKIDAEINGEYRLTFDVTPRESTWSDLNEGALLECEGQKYRVYSANEENGGAAKKSLDCVHVITDASLTHLPRFPILSGGVEFWANAHPRDIMVEAFRGTDFVVLRTDQAPWITDTTDFWVVDKTNPLEVVNKLLEQFPYAEMYVDNYNIALVMRLGFATRERLDMRKNLMRINRSKDIDDVITRLYAYGRDGLSLASPGYVASPFLLRYGCVRDGFRTFDWIDGLNPDITLLEAAQAMFSEDNPNRIDVPKVTYTIEYIDLMKAGIGVFVPRLGDSVVIVDSVLGIEETQRIRKYEYYPYSPERSRIELGKSKTTLKDHIKKIIRMER